jgi:hypothetical protein
VVIVLNWKNVGLHSRPSGLILMDDMFRLGHVWWYPTLTHPQWSCLIPSLGGRCCGRRSWDLSPGWVQHETGTIRKAGRFRRGIWQRILGNQWMFFRV